MGRVRKTFPATLWSPGATEGHYSGASICPASSAVCLRSLLVQSALLQQSFCYCFSFQWISLSLAPGKGKLLKASKILYSEKISAGRNRSGSYDKMFESLARSLSPLVVASLYISRNLWKSQAQSWHLSLLSTIQLLKSGQMKIHLLSHLSPIPAVQISSHTTF